MLLRIGLGLLAIAAISYLLLVTNVLTAGPCGGNGYFALFAIFITVPLGFVLTSVAVLRMYFRKRKLAKGSA